MVLGASMRHPTLQGSAVLFNCNFFFDGRQIKFTSWGWGGRAIVIIKVMDKTLINVSLGGIAILTDLSWIIF